MYQISHTSCSSFSCRKHPTMHGFFTFILLFHTALVLYTCKIIPGYHLGHANQTQTVCRVSTALQKTITEENSCFSYIKCNKTNCPSSESNLEALEGSEFTKAQWSMLEGSDITQYKTRLPVRNSPGDSKSTTQQLIPPAWFVFTLESTCMQKTTQEYTNTGIFRYKLFWWLETHLTLHLTANLKPH